MKNKLLVYFAVLLLALIISLFTTRANLDTKTISILIFLLVFIPTLISPSIGLIIIIISMLFSPDIPITGGEATLRIEDVFLLVVILATLIRIALTKDISKLFKTRLTVPFFLYLLVCVISTILASIMSEINIKHSFFVMLKYLEYFLLFLIVKDNITSLRQVKIFVAIFLLVALMVTLHANRYIQQQERAGVTFFRTHPPVETKSAGQSGTLGGYLLFMMAIAGGLFLYMRPVTLRAFLILLIILMYRSFLYSLSRGSYFAFLPMVLTLIFLSRKITFTFAVIIFLLLVTLSLPLMIKERITEIVTVKEGIEGSYVELDESARHRLHSWNYVLFERFPMSPIFGFGVGKFFVDGQIFLTLCEVGLIGVILLVWVWVRLFKMAREALNTALLKNNRFGTGLSAGFLTGFVGLIFQALSTNTFIIIRIMEPFWFMAAIVLSLPELLQQEQEREVVAQIDQGSI